MLPSGLSVANREKKNVFVPVSSPNKDQSTSFKKLVSNRRPLAFQNALALPPIKKQLFQIRRRLRHELASRLFVPS